jgi:DNA-binding transcriptional LysR family regulator
MTKAAELLNLSQSGVSHALSSLESEFGFPLLTRDRSGISLTSNGTRILEHVREILHQNERLKKEVAAINGLEIGLVRIGTFTSISTQWLPGVIAQFHSYHPTIEIELLDGNYDEIENWIANGTVDFGFVSLPTTKLYEIIPLKRDRMLCILPAKYPLQYQKTILLDDIKDEPFIMPKWGSVDDVKRILHQSKVKLKVKYEVTDDRAIIAMVSNGLGISILPEMVLSRTPENVNIACIEQSPYRTIGIAAHSIKNISPSAKKFINCTKSWLSDHNLLDF